MTLSSSLLAVAGTGCPPELAELLAAGGLEPARRDADPATVPWTARQVKKLRAEDAEAAVAYLADDVLCELFTLDTRKGVRWAVCAQGHRLDDDTATAAWRWAVADGARGQSVTLATLARALPLDELVAAAGDRWGGYSQLAGRTLARRVQGTAQLDDVLARIAGGSATATAELLSAAVCGLVDGVTADDGVARRGTFTVADLVRRAPRLTAGTVARALADDDYATGVSEWGQSRHRYEPDDDVRGTLTGAAGDGHLARALRLWDALRAPVDELLACADPSAAAGLDPETAAALAVRTTLAPWRHALLLRCCDGAGTSPALLVQLGRCDDTDVLRHALGTLEEPARSDLAAQLCRRTGATVAPLRDELLASGAPVEARAELVDAHCDPRVAEDVARGLVAALGAPDGHDRHRLRAQAERLLHQVPLPEGLLAPLAVAANAGNWLGSGSPANPRTVAVAAEVVRTTTSSVTAAMRDLGDLSGIVDACVERACGETPAVTYLWDNVALGADHVDRLCAAWHDPTVDVFLHGSAANAVTHETRAAVVRHGGWTPRRLVESFSKLAPAGDEEHAALRAALVDLSAAAHAVLHVPMGRDDLRTALLAAPRTAPAWAAGETANAYDAGLLAEVVDQLADDPGFDAVAMAGQLAALDGGHELLAGHRGFLEQLQMMGRRGQGAYAATRVLWQVCHEALGDDTVAWSQVAAQLDTWPGTLAELIGVAKAVSGQ